LHTKPHLNYYTQNLGTKANGHFLGEQEIINLDDIGGIEIYRHIISNISAI